MSACAYRQEARKVNYNRVLYPCRHNYTAYVTHTPCVDVSYLPHTRDTLLYPLISRCFTNSLALSLGLDPVVQAAAGAKSEPAPSNGTSVDGDDDGTLCGRLLEEALQEKVKKQMTQGKGSEDEGRKSTESSGKASSSQELVGDLLELLRFALGGVLETHEEKVCAINI